MLAHSGVIGFVCITKHFISCLHPATHSFTLLYVPSKMGVLMSHVANFIRIQDVVLMSDLIGMHPALKHDY